MVYAFECEARQRLDQVNAAIAWYRNLLCGQRAHFVSEEEWEGWKVELEDWEHQLQELVEGCWQR